MLCKVSIEQYKCVEFRVISLLCADETKHPFSLYLPPGAKVGKKKKVKGGTKTSKSNGTCWANMPLPPPPMHPLPGTEVDLDRYPQENHGGG